MINVGRDYFVNKLTCSTLQNIDHIQMGLDFGFNSYESISDACPGAVFRLPHHTKYLNICCLPGKQEIEQIFIIAIASGIILNDKICLETKDEENLILTLNCRENMTLSVAPLILHIKEREDEDVGDVAIIKFIRSPDEPLPSSYTAVCEGLILRKFLISFYFMGVESFVWVRSPLMKNVGRNVRS